MNANATEPDLKELLENSRQQLAKPFAKTQRRLLVFLNVTYLVLVPTFLISEKLATGRFVPHPFLGVIYLVVAATNLISALYNYLLLIDKRSLSLLGKTIQVKGSLRTDDTIRWASILSLMGMSFFHMIGFGNPSNDSILTDFALGHSLIVLAAILIGRNASFVWFIIVLGILVYVTLRNGYSYQFNYLTPAESSKYQQALEAQQPWALARKAALETNGLNPPKLSRYFNTWLVFILVAFLTAYFFNGITHDMFKIIPTVTEDIKNAIDASSRREIEQEREKNQVEEQRLLFQQEALRAELNFLKSQVNPHFLYNTLNYFYIKAYEHSEELAESIRQLSDIMRYSLKDNSDKVTLHEEIEYTEKFISLHQLRYENKLNVDFSVEGDILKRQILPLILISLVENSFKHGKLNDPNYPLIVRINAAKDYTEFLVTNRKSGKNRFESTNIGISNLRRRLDLAYQSGYTLDIRQDDIIYSCNLIIRT